MGGCFCPALEEGVFRHHAATRRLTVLEDLPPRAASSMVFPSARLGGGRVDSALEERILINQMSMARVKEAMRLTGALPLVPTASAAFVGSGKALPPVPEVGDGGCPSTTETCNCPDIPGVSHRDPSVKSAHTGIGMKHHEPTINKFLQPSTHGSHIASSSASTATMAPPRPAKCTIPHSMSNNDISEPLPAPPRAKVRHTGLTPSYSSPAIYTSSPAIYTSPPAIYTSSPAIYTEAVYIVDGHVQIPGATPRPFSIGRPLTLEERVERLARMREEAMATVEAREREAMGLGNIEEEDEKNRAIAECSVWI